MSQTRCEGGHVIAKISVGPGKIKIYHQIHRLPNDYQVTSTGAQFLAYYSGVRDANRIFIFASPQALRYLCSSN